MSRKRASSCWCRSELTVEMVFDDVRLQQRMAISKAISEVRPPKGITDQAQRGYIAGLMAAMCAIDDAHIQKKGAK